MLHLYAHRKGIHPGRFLLSHVESRSGQRGSKHHLRILLMSCATLLFQSGKRLPNLPVSDKMSSRGSWQNDLHNWYKTRSLGCSQAPSTTRPLQILWCIESGFPNICLYGYRCLPIGQCRLCIMPYWPFRPSGKSHQLDVRNNNPRAFHSRFYSLEKSNRCLKHTYVEIFRFTQIYPSVKCFKLSWSISRCIVTT